MVQPMFDSRYTTVLITMNRWIKVYPAQPSAAVLHIALRDFA